jgi:hypothetical protein
LWVRNRYCLFTIFQNKKSIIWTKKAYPDYIHYYHTNPWTPNDRPTWFSKPLEWKDSLLIYLNKLLTVLLFANHIKKSQK